MLHATHLLPIIWGCIAAFTVLAYIVLDGFDLGLGILFAVETDQEIAEYEACWSMPVPISSTPG